MVDLTYFGLICIAKSPCFRLIWASRGNVEWFIVVILTDIRRQGGMLNGLL